MPTSLKRTAEREILRRILSGELVPGEFVNRRDMAIALGMSVAPVLEAMLLLESEGLLESIPRKGTRVCIHRPEDVWGQFLAREALECQLARQIFGAPVVGDFDRLANLARRVDGCRRESDVDLWESEIEFHTALADLIGSPAFTRLFRKVMRADLFYKMRWSSGAKPDLRRSHFALIVALRDAPNAVTAENICRTDLHHGRDTRNILNNIQTKTLYKG